MLRKKKQGENEGGTFCLPPCVLRAIPPWVSKQSKGRWRPWSPHHAGAIWSGSSWDPASIAARCRKLQPGGHVSLCLSLGGRQQCSAEPPWPTFWPPASLDLWTLPFSPWHSPSCPHRQCLPNGELLRCGIFVLFSFVLWIPECLKITGGYYINASRMHAWMNESMNEWTSILAYQSLPSFPFLWFCRRPMGAPRCNSTPLSKMEEKHFADNRHPHMSYPVMNLGQLGPHETHKFWFSH